MFHQYLPEISNTVRNAKWIVWTIGIWVGSAAMLRHIQFWIPVEGSLTWLIFLSSNPLCCRDEQSDGNWVIIQNYKNFFCACEEGSVSLRTYLNFQGLCFQFRVQTSVTSIFHLLFFKKNGVFVYTWVKVFSSSKKIINPQWPLYIWWEETSKTHNHPTRQLLLNTFSTLCITSQEWCSELPLK